MSKRLNLREFQQDLIERMQAKGRGDDQISTLGVQIAEQNWLVDMHDLSEVLPLPPLSAVPLTKPWFVGVINVRGMLYGVSDMAAYQQKGRASGAAVNRVLLLAERHAFNAALLVDRVLVCATPAPGRKARLAGKFNITMSREISGISST